LAGSGKARKVIHSFDENPPEREPGQESGNSASPEEQNPSPLVSYENAPEIPPIAGAPGKVYPPDLQISWSWPHLILFLSFIVISLVCVQGAFLAMYAPPHSMNTEQLEDYMLSKPQVAIGSTVLLYALLLLFLYVTLALLRGQPFWKTLGWRKILPKNNGTPWHPAVFFFTGCALSLLVFALTSVIKTPEKAPIEEIFKYKLTAILFVVTAVLVAPLAEETIFRGYLYPMFARWFGVAPSVVVTGFLFGLMHGPQLGGAKSLIAVMTLVGIVFTAVRARTGSVFASFLMHLGYNSLIGVSLAIATHGFTQPPPTQ
jgi:membrane protease YdiL (CAAX protease family)